jgi:hypothetical protein
VSSAILYVAIVVIWACVLIPRWLRRDSARGSSHAADQATPVDVTPPDADSPGHVPASTGAVAVAEEHGDDRAEDRRDNRAEEREDARAEKPRHEVAEDPSEPDEVPPPLTPEESRRRVLSARRRLLGMLIVLEVAAISLAVLKLAAMWVVIPPSVMLAGYLLILREASHADAERAAREAEAVAYARARARERARVRERAARDGTVAGKGGTGRAAPAAPAAPAAQYEDFGPGRDFAPGLAGKYTTSNAAVIDITARAGDEFPQESPDSKLRAVGD